MALILLKWRILILHFMSNRKKPSKTRQIPTTSKSKVNRIGQMEIKVTWRIVMQSNSVELIIMSLTFTPLLYPSNCMKNVKKQPLLKMCLYLKKRINLTSWMTFGTLQLRQECAISRETCALLPDAFDQNLLCYSYINKQLNLANS